MTEWWIKNYNRIYSDSRTNKIGTLNYWRESLLSINGVGRETADCILLYSFNFPSFVIDTYTRRIMARHYNINQKISYENLRTFFMNKLPADFKLYKEFHALFVKLAKEACTKNQCMKECPLRN